MNIIKNLYQKTSFYYVNKISDYCNDSPEIDIAFFSSIEKCNSFIENDIEELKKEVLLSYDCDEKDIKIIKSKNVVKVEIKECRDIFIYEIVKATVNENKLRSIYF